MLEDFENASPYFCTFLPNRTCDLKVTRRFKCATLNWYESVVNLTALKRDAVDDVTLANTASSIILQSQLKLFDFFCLNCGKYDTISSNEVCRLFLIKSN